MQSICFELHVFVPLTDTRVPVGATWVYVLIYLSCILVSLHRKHTHARTHARTQNACNTHARTHVHKYETNCKFVYYLSNDAVGEDESLATPFPGRVLTCSFPSFSVHLVGVAVKNLPVMVVVLLV